MKIKYLYFLMSLSLVFTACENDLDSLSDPYVPEVSGTIPTPTFTSGSADFSNYVAIGNSLTAGFSDGALFMEGQDKSFTNILSQQFSLAGGGNFTIPMMNDNVGGLLFNGSPNPAFGPRLIFDPVGQMPVPVNGTPSTEVFDIQPGPYNNMGVPGVKVSHLLYDGLGNPANLGVSANPYYVRMASSTSSTILGDALAMNPTFFTLWIGNNDVLGYAINGGDASLDQITPLTGGVGVGFTETYNYVLGALAASGAQGVVINIPSVTDAPHFTTVPYAPLDPTNPDFGPQIPMLNMVFGALNPIFEAIDPNRAIVFSETAASPVVIKDETLADISAIIEAQLNASPTFPAFIGQFGLPPQAAPMVANLLGTLYGQTRQATADDLLLLPSSSVIGQVNSDFSAYLQTQNLPVDLANQFSIQGVTYGLDDKYVLLPSEQMEIEDATTAFNQVISDAAATYNMPMFDVNTFFNQVSTSGYQAGSAYMTADFVTGGTFSLDGIHPSPRGNAVIVNQLIGVINTSYNSNLPDVNPVDYTGVYLN